MENILACGCLVLGLAALAAGIWCLFIYLPLVPAIAISAAVLAVGAFALLIVDKVA